MRRILIAFVAVLILSTIANFLIHGVILQPAYHATPHLIRAEQDASSHAPFLLWGFVFFSLGFVWIYARGVQAKPWLAQGMQYGFAMWLIASVSRYVIYYAIQPWAPAVILMQIGYELVMMLVLGATVGAIIRTKAA
jgi:hypothetical protein